MMTFFSVESLKAQNFLRCQGRIDNAGKKFFYFFRYQLQLARFINLSIADSLSHEQSYKRKRFDCSFSYIISLFKFHR